VQGSRDLAAYRRRMAEEPIIEAPKQVPSWERKDADYSPSSDRDVSALQEDQGGSPALQDPDIDRDAVQVLPGTGDYTDDGAVDVDPGEVHLPRNPDSAAVGPVADREPADGGR
jgi:hypothetical protein